ncbi:MBL fold metallo-hydrolase [Chloroflexota bacterium]
MTSHTHLEHLHALELPTPFPVGPITVYLTDAPGEPLTLIDTGPRTPDTRAALQVGLRAQGYSPADLGRIIVTHAHVDHFGLAGELASASGARVLTHRWNIPSLADYRADRERRTAFYSHLLFQASVPRDVGKAVDRATQAMHRFAEPVAVSDSLEDGQTLRLAGREWQVLHTPGHAAGLVCLYEPSSHLLLSSDHLLADISSNPVVEPPPPGHDQRLHSLVLYKESLQRLGSMEIVEALPSHGPPIQNVRDLVGRRLSFHRRRSRKVVAAIRDGASTTWNIALALFPNRSSLDTFLAVSEVIGHLDMLEIEGLILAEEKGGRIRWTLTGEGVASALSLGSASALS